MRALFVYKYLTMGGVEAVLRARLEGLPESGVDAQAWFLADGPGREAFEGVAPRVHVGGLAALERFLEAEKIDLVSSIDTEEIFPLMGRLGEGPALVVEVHSPYPENLAYLRHVGRVPVRAFFVPSAYQEAVARQRLGAGARVWVVPNPLGAGFAAPLRDFEPAPPEPVVAWVGRLDELKNWKEFIDLAGALPQGTGASFWMAGSSPGGEAAPDLYRRAKRRGVLNRLRWFRDLPYPRVPRLLDAVRSSGGVVLSTSRGESFGLTIAEAMARACAVVVPAASPFREFVEHGRHGLSYPPGEVEQGAACVERLIREGALRERMGASGRADILARHSPGRALPELARALREVMGERNDRAAV
jgi:glycosyltransferase involved in cell wall biosynthesis